MTGDYSGPCCCGSVTRLKGGIHPDSIRTVHLDMSIRPSINVSFNNQPILSEPGHLISASVSLMTIKRDTATGHEHYQIDEHATFQEAWRHGMHPVNVSLYTLPAFVNANLTKGGFLPAEAYDDARKHLWNAAVSGASPQASTPDDLYGLFFDGALFVEFNGPDSDYAARITLAYVPRAQFSPAYPDPVQVLQHYWKCGHSEEEFLEGFYGGTSFDIDSSVPISGGSSGGSVFSISTNPGSPLQTTYSIPDW